MEHRGENKGSVASLASSRALLGAIYSDPGLQNDDAVRARFALTLSKGDGWTLMSVFTNPALVGEAIDDQIPNLALPTLVIWGAEDHLIPLNDGKDFAARIPGARLVVIPHAGHAPEIEQTQPYLAAFLPFIDAPSSHP
jgi:pimeloyl-ACP methyl ester carboxylesterase